MDSADYTDSCTDYEGANPFHPCKSIRLIRCLIPCQLCASVVKFLFPLSQHLVCGRDRQHAKQNALQVEQKNTLTENKSSEKDAEHQANQNAC